MGVEKQMSCPLSSSRHLGPSCPNCLCNLCLQHVFPFGGLSASSTLPAASKSGSQRQLLGPASTTAIQNPAMAPSALCLPSAPLDPTASLSDCGLLSLPSKTNLGHSQVCCSHFQESSQELFFSLRDPLGAALASIFAGNLCSPQNVADSHEDPASRDRRSHGDFEHPYQEVSSSEPATSSGHECQVDDANLLLHFTDQVNSRLVPVLASN